MWKYIFRTTWTYLLALLLITFIVFTLYAQFKPSPFEDQLEEFRKNNNEVGYQQLLALYGLNKSPVERYGEWLGNFFRGNWGQIYNPLNQNFVFANGSVTDIFFVRITTSSQFLVPSYFIALFLGFPIGILMGYQFASRSSRGRLIDSVFGGFVQLLSGIPSYVWAIFALLLGPLLGLPTTFATNFGLSYQVRTLILPTLILVIVSLVGWSIRLRIEVSRVLVSDYILAARARGFSKWLIFRRYVLRNALYPYVGSLFSSFMIVFSGSLVLETYFSIPGVSRPLVEASRLGELNILMFNIVFFGLLGALVNIFTTALQLSIDPRVRSQLGDDWKIVTQARAFFARRKNRQLVLVSADEKALND